MDEAWEILNKFITPFLDFIKRIFDFLQNLGGNSGEGAE